MTGRQYDHRDRNESKLTRILEQGGAVCIPIKGRKAGTPDLVVGYRGSWILVEVKNPDGRNQLSEQQIEFEKLCEFRGLPFKVIRTEKDCEELLA